MRRLILGALAVAGAFSILVVAPHAGAAARATHGAWAQSLAMYFPTASQYPTGYQPLSVQQYADPSQLFAGANATLAARVHFVTGATQTAFGPKNTVVWVTIARFRNAAGATHFRAAVHSDVIDDGHQKTGTLRSLGSSNAWYESGNCASCGPGSPPLLQVFFARGPYFVEIGSQPTNQSMSRHLGALIDARLKRAQVR